MRIALILKVGGSRDVETKYGKKTKQDVRIRLMDSKEELEIGYWNPDGGFPFKVGDSISLELRDRDYKGKKYYDGSKGEIVDLPKELNDMVSEKDEMWRKKEIRDYRGRCLMYALETVKMSNEETKTCNTAYNESVIKESAERYFEWIYREEPKESQEEPF